MVGSKDTKRKRKEIESSPEVPKRTKVQAQRKFAQGQSAPSSAYSSAPSCSNGPNTPATRDPPIEILPNKRPKTEDFLTFLCFRTAAHLPPYLNYLKGKSKDGRVKKPTPATKKPVKATKNIGKQKKKGRPKGSGKATAAAAAAAEAATSSTSSPAKNTKSPAKGATTMAGGGDKVTKPASAAEKSTDQPKKPQDGIASKSTSIPFAVRKRAEQVPEGNRAPVGRQLRNAKSSTTTTTAATTAATITSKKSAIDDSKIESSNIRRSNRNNPKETKTDNDAENDNADEEEEEEDDDEDDDDEDDDQDEDEDEDEDEYFSAHDDIDKIDEKPPMQHVTNAAKAPKEMISNDENKPVQTSPPPKEGNDKTKDLKKPPARTTLAKQKNTNSKADVDNTLPSTSGINNNKSEIATINQTTTAKRGLKTDVKTDGAKEKPPPVKRARQKETPIFIPSPEPSGRMTRQRAFFEPVKVPHRSEDEDKDKAEIENSKSVESDATRPELDKSTKETLSSSSATHKAVTNSQNEQKAQAELSGKEREASDLKVFDFSSDDEQPLAKSIKLKKTVPNAKSNAAKKTKPIAASSVTTETAATAGAPSRPSGKKLQPKKNLVPDKKTPSQVSPAQKKTMTKELKNERNFKIHITSDEMEEEAAATASATATAAAAATASATVNTTTSVSGKKQNEAADQLDEKSKTINNATGTKRGGKTVKESDASNTKAESTELKVDPQKKPSNTRQPRKRTKAQDDAAQDLDAENEVETGTAQARTQRPTRKTKEAATIYMGIIGHKLQLADDEDDDLSLNSFPDLPNVKEVEKMEIELKKNASQSPSCAPKSSQASTSTAVEKQPTPAPVSKPAPVRRGRPPKQATKPATETSVSKGGGNKRSAASVSPKKGNDSVRAEDTVTSAKNKDAAVTSSEKFDSDDEDFLLSKEVNVTKRNLAKSFSDSDDEPLAIKVQVKGSGAGEKDPERDTSQPSTIAAQTQLTTSTSTPVTESAPPVLQTSPSSTAQKVVPTPPPQQHANAQATAMPGVRVASTPSPQQQQTLNQQHQHHHQQHQHHQQQQHSAPSPFKSSEKKSPVPTSKILNVPATYGTPPAAAAPVNVPGVMNAGNYGKAYLPPANYHPQLPQVNVRPMPAMHTPHNQMPVQVHLPGVPIGTAPPPVGHGPMVPIPTQPMPMQPIPMQAIPMQAMATQPIPVQAVPTQQTSMKYPSSTVTYPPPIEAYPSPKINPNFLTPKFDRMSMPRSNNNVPSPSPVPAAATPAPAPTSAQSPAPVPSPSPAPTPAPAQPPATTTTATTPSVAPAPSAATVPPAAAAATPAAAATTTQTTATSTTTTTATVATTTTTTTTNSKATAAPKTPSSNTPTQATQAPAGAAAAVVASTSTAADASSALNIAELLKDNLMPSKEESGKIFGIASVSLAQSSGPDNTKCTLGKCGSIHKPILGPVVPTESYIGDQMSSKERRKAKVNMTHEQIQKWLIECSANPDKIEDDLDDDFDDNLRPNMFTTTPPLTREDKEIASVSSSSKVAREAGKSENASSTKGVSAKATPVAAAVSSMEPTTEAGVGIVSEEKTNAEPVGGAIEGQSSTNNALAQNSSHEAKLTTTKETPEADAGKEQQTAKTNAAKDSSVKESAVEEKPESSNRPEKEKEPQSTSKNAAAALDRNRNRASPSVGKSSPSAKNNAASPTAPPATPLATETKETESPSVSTANPNKAAATSSTSQAAAAGAAKALKRTPVYNQKAQKQIELKETTTTSHRKSAPFSYGAFSADNEKSVYSFDKDDEDEDDAAADGGENNQSKSKPAFRRQSRRDSQLNEDTPTTAATTPTKKRAAAAAAEKANKDLANASHNNSSVSLTLSPAEASRQVKVSLDAEKKDGGSNQSMNTTNSSAKNAEPNAKKTADSVTTDKRESGRKQNPAGASGDKKDGDSDSEGHTFYIPLQGSSAGKDNNGSIQGVAVKLGREGPDGPNQKVIMHATLVTKAQIGNEANASGDVKTLENALTSGETAGNRRGTKASASAATTSAAAAAAAASTSAAASTRGKGAGAQSSSKGSSAGAGAAGTSKEESGNAGGSLVRVNSNSSLLSGSAKSRAGAGTNAGGGGAAGSQPVGGKKAKDDTPIKMANNTAFPRHDDPTQMVEAPIFRPTEKEFADPIEFIERITPIAARFGICKIIPPSTFKPECRISDDMRFTAYNQYVHKMLYRWGPSAKEMSAIKKYLATQSIVMNHPPWIGGMEVDLPRLYHTVQELGGLKEVIEKKKWARVAEEMCIPKLAQDRVTKLDDIYCKYLLPYDTLSPAERQKLFDEVEADWAKREARARRNADRFVNTESVSNEEDDDTSENDDEESEEEVDGVSMECIVKGRSMPLSQFYRIARNTMALWFKNTEPTVTEVEAEFWRHVAVRDSHVCVHSGSIDSSGWGYGFPSPGPKGKGSNYARHPWNLKVLTNNPGSVLRSLGPVMGVTVPTLHVGMLFSACCWYRDPHGLSWIEYLHTGASKLWYGIPDDQSANFRAALTSLIPTHCQNKTIWLPCDTVMVPPHMLTDRGVSLCRTEQRPGEFIVIFPRAYTSSVSTGYVVSESVYFATNSWLELAKDDFRDIHDSCEPAMFSLEQLLFALGHDQRVVSDTLEQMLPMLHEVCEKESAAREQLKAAGVTSTEMVHNEKGAKGKKLLPPFRSVESECDLCRANLYISMVRTDEGNVYCLQHALKNLNNGNIQAKQCKLFHAYNVDDIEKLIKALNDRIQLKRSAANKKAK